MRYRALLFAFALFAAIAPPRLQAADPVQIDVVIPLTGPSAFLGKNQFDTLGIFEKATNAAGGVRGRPIHFNILDDQSSPQVAVQLVNGLLPRHPSLIMGFSTIAECSAVTPLVSSSGPLLYCFTPVSQPPAGGYVFASSVSTEYMMPVQLRFFRDRGFHKLAILATTDATGQQSERTLRSTLTLPENASLHIVAAEHFNPTDVSIAAIVANIKAAEPDIIFGVANGPAFGTLLRSLHDAGVDVPVLASAANMNYEQLAQYNGFVPKELLFNGFVFQDPSAVRGTLRRQIDAGLAAFRTANVRPTVLHALAWDPSVLLLDALRSIGPDATATQLRDYLEQLHGKPALTGIYDFRSGNQHGLNETSVILVRWEPKTADFKAVTGPAGAPLAKN
jgi:branched-chain amino acid transport system substrate-binding protein